MINWVIQKTLAGKGTLTSLTEAITENNGEFELIEVIPFDTQINYTASDNRKPIIYGSGTYDHDLGKIIRAVHGHVLSR